MDLDPVYRDLRFDLCLRLRRCLLRGCFGSRVLFPGPCTALESDCHADQKDHDADRDQDDLCHIRSLTSSSSPAPSSSGASSSCPGSLIPGILYRHDAVCRAGLAGSSARSAVSKCVTHCSHLLFLFSGRIFSLSIRFSESESARSFRLLQAADPGTENASGHRFRKTRRYTGSSIA